MKKLLFALAAVVTLGLVGGGVAQATTNMQTGTDVRLGTDEVVDASYYAAGETVVIEGTVKGDVYCAGQNVEVRGTVEGDVMCAGQEIRIGGTVQGDVRVAGQNVFIDGEVQQSVTAMGQMISVDGKIGRDATLTGQNMRLAGELARDAVVTGERLVISGSVGRNLQMTGEHTSLREGATISGNVAYTSNNEAEIDSGAVVTGEIVRQDPPQSETGKVSPMAWVAAALIAFVFLLPIGVIYIAFAPRAAGSAVEYMRRKTLITVGLGFLSLFLIPFVAIAFMVTVIGLPLGVMLFMLWAMALPVAFVIGAYTVGAWITAVDVDHSSMRKFLAMLVGLPLFILLSFLPYVGWAITLLAMIGGFGVITMGVARAIRAQYTKQPAKKKAKAE